MLMIKSMSPLNVIPQNIDGCYQQAESSSVLSSVGFSMKFKAVNSVVNVEEEKKI